MADKLLAFKTLNPDSEASDNSIILLAGSEVSPSFQVECSGHKKLQVQFCINVEGNEETSLFEKSEWEAMVADPSRDGEIELTNLESGAILIENIDKNTPTTITFTLENFKVNSTPGPTSCYLRYQESYPDPDDEDETLTRWTDDESSKIIITKIPEPKIAQLNYFKADRYGINNGASVTLSWDSVNTEFYTLRSGFSEQRIEKDVNEITIEKSTGNYDFELIPYNDSPSPDAGESKELTISVFSGTSSEIISGRFPEGAVIMGLYSYNEQLYAIVLPDAFAEKANLYTSQEGFSTWEKVYITPHTEVVEIDRNLAGSPGVIFNEQLWLIGGSSYDSGLPGNEVGIYDFGSRTWRVNNNPAGFDARMGHTCLLFNEDKEIWVMGGYHPDKGTLDDCWVYIQNSGWVEKSKAIIPGNGRCMMGAAVYEKDIWIFGGFNEEPGGASVSFRDTYRWIEEENKWDKIIWKADGISGLQPDDYFTSGLSVINDMLYLFTTDPANTSTRQIYNENGWKVKNKEQSADWGLEQSGYSVQLTPYLGMIWLRVLRLAGKKVGGVAGGDLFYFYDVIQ